MIERVAAFLGLNELIVVTTLSVGDAVEGIVDASSSADVDFVVAVRVVWLSIRGDVARLLQEVVVRSA